MAIDRNAIRRRAERRAADKYAAAQARIGSQEQAARDAYHTSVGATRGAATQARAALNDQIAGLSDSGLKGLALQQVKDELLGQITGTHGAVAFQKASARPDLQSTLAALEDKAFTISQSQASTADSLYNSGVTRQRALAKKENQRVRNTAQSAIAKVDNAVSKIKGLDKEVADAIGEIRHHYETTDGFGASAAGLQKGSDELAASADARRQAIDTLVTTQGISRTAAAEAIRLFVRRHRNPIGVSASTPSLAANTIAGAVDSVDLGG